MFLRIAEAIGIRCGILPQRDKTHTLQVLNSFVYNPAAKGKVVADVAKLLQEETTLPPPDGNVAVAPLAASETPAAAPQPGSVLASAAAPAANATPAAGSVEPLAKATPAAPPAKATAASPAKAAPMPKAAAAPRSG